METRGQRRTVSAEPTISSTVTTSFTVSTEWLQGKTASRQCKVMTCNHCQHQEPFNVFRMEPHLATCESYMLSQMSIGERLRRLEAIPISSLDKLLVEVQAEFDLIRSERFNRVHLMRGRLLQDWKDFWQLYQQLRQIVRAKISQAEGSPNAQRLAEALLSEKLDYGNFKLTFPTPLGEEIISIEVEACDPSKMPEPPESLAPPQDRELSVVSSRTGSDYSTIRLSELDEQSERRGSRSRSGTLAPSIEPVGADFHRQDAPPGTEGRPIEVRGSTAPPTYTGGEVPAVTSQQHTHARARGWPAEGRDDTSTEAQLERCQAELRELRDKYDGARKEHISAIEWHRASVERTNKLLHEAIQDRDTAWGEEARLRSELHKPSDLRMAWASVRKQLKVVVDTQKQQASDMSEKFATAMRDQLSKSQSELNKVNAEFTLRQTQDAQKIDELRAELEQAQSALASANTRLSKLEEENGGLRSRIRAEGPSHSPAGPGPQEATTPAMPAPPQGRTSASPAGEISFPIRPKTGRAQTPGAIEIDLSASVSVELSSDIWYSLEPINLSQAKRELRWISRTPSGHGFCLTCSCPKMVVPASSPGSPTTHIFVPRYFHNDPFGQDSALRHYREVHGEEILGVDGLVRKYGRKGRQAPRGQSFPRR